MLLKKADDNEARYYLVPDSILSVKDGQNIFAGDVIARLPKETTKNKRYYWWIAACSRTI